MDGEKPALVAGGLEVGFLEGCEATRAEDFLGPSQGNWILDQDPVDPVGTVVNLADLRSGIFPPQFPRPLPRILAVFELLRVDLEVLQNLEEHGVEVGGVEGGGLRGHGVDFVGGGSIWKVTFIVFSEPVRTKKARSSTNCGRWGVGGLGFAGNGSLRRLSWDFVGA